MSLAIETSQFQTNFDTFMKTSCICFVLTVSMFMFSGAFRQLSRNYVRCGRSQLLVRSVAMSGKIFLNVPFDDKEEVKKRGGRWDVDAKKWYIGDGASPADFAQWTGSGATQANTITWLKVPFSDKDEVKALGAKWDIGQKRWCVPPGASVRVFERWLDTKESTKGATNIRPADTKKTEAFSPKSILFLDIETSGLPASSKGSYPPPATLSAYDGARAVMVSASLCDLRSLREKEAFSCIVKADDFPITNAQFHGVTDARSQQEGEPFAQVAARLERLLAAPQGCVAVAAHNVAFDVAVLSSELHRHGQAALAEKLEGLKALCTMQLTREAVGLRDVAGKPKNPTMRELYAYALGEDRADKAQDLGVLQVREAFTALVERGVLGRTLLDGL